jgi:cell division protease FtsH
MSDRLGPLTLGTKQGEVFLGRDFASHPDYSDQVAFEIDSEIRRMIDDAHDEALEILQLHRSKLDELAGILLEKETIEKDELLQILAGMEKRPQRNPEQHGAGLAISRRSVRPAEPPPRQLG